MNGWLLVRVAGIVVGIATLLRLATNEGLVTYDPLFLAWMDWLSDIVELGFLTKLIGPFLQWGIEYVRSFGISVPDLQDEWNPAFVLSMLMLGAASRHGGRQWLLLSAPAIAIGISVWSGISGSLMPVAGLAFGIGFGLGTLGGLGVGGVRLAEIAIIFVFILTVGLLAFGVTGVVLVALAVCGGLFLGDLLRGGGVLGSRIVRFVGAIGFVLLLVFMGVSLTIGNPGRYALVVVGLVLSVVHLFGVVRTVSTRIAGALSVAILIGSMEGSTYLSAIVSSVVVVSIGIVLLVFVHWWRSRMPLRALLKSASFNIGFDILSVMLGALGLASLFASPPIW
jgi:hypothetical protein